MLDIVVTSYPARFTMLMGRKDIDLTHDITMRLKPTGRAAIIAPPWFVSMRAVGAGLRSVRFVLRYRLNTFCFGLVFNIRTDIAVMPSANLLIVLLAKVDTIGNILDVAIDNLVGFKFNSNVNYLAAYLVGNIAHHLIMFGNHARLGTNQFAVTATAPHSAIDSLIDLGKPFSVTLHLVPTLAAGYDGCFILIANDGGMNLARVHTDSIAARGLLLCLAVFNDKMPIVATGFFVEDETYLTDLQDVADVVWHGDDNLGAAPALRKRESSTVQLDSRVLPDRSAEFLATPREINRWINFADGTGCDASFEESLLRSIYCMCVQWRLPH